MVATRTTPGPEWSTRETSELSSIWPGARFQSPPGAFAADIRRARLGDLVFESLRLTPHSGVREATALHDDGRRAISIEIVTVGAIWRSGMSGDYVHRKGEVALAWTHEPFAYSLSSPGTLLRTILPLDAVQSRVVGAAGLTSGPLAPRAHVQGYSAFMTKVVDTVIDRPAVDVEFERAVWWLQLALLKDATKSATSLGKPEGRARIHAYIESHLFDPDLSVSSIARALEISVRSVHNAFNDRGTTAAKSIRTARVLAAADSLRMEHAEHPRPNAAVAIEFGFTSIEALQRAFLEQFGQRVHQYRNSLTS